MQSLLQEPLQPEEPFSDFALPCTADQDKSSSPPHHLLLLCCLAPPQCLQGTRLRPAVFSLRRGGNIHPRLMVNRQPCSPLSHSCNPTPLLLPTHDLLHGDSLHSKLLHGNPLHCDSLCSMVIHSTVFHSTSHCHVTHQNQHLYVVSHHCIDASLHNESRVMREPDRHSGDSWPSASWPSTTLRSTRLTARICLCLAPR